MTNGNRLLLVGDDPAISGMLGEQLRLHEEFSVVTAATAARALDCVGKDHYDLVVVDIGLPDMDGHELCRRMRLGGVKVPIIMLTGSDSDAATIAARASGATDVVAKPLRLGVLLARIRAHIHQHERSDDAMVSIGPYSFQPSARMLVNVETAEKIRLTDKETSILKYLYRAGDQVVSRAVLLDEVWGYNSRVDTHTLETHVYRLRQKIEPDSSRATILVTEAGGYRLVP